MKNITFSHLDKILFPKKKITKKDVIDYYGKVANYFLPHVKNHLMVMQRFPDGITKEGFFQKQIPDYFPKWVERKAIETGGGKRTLVMVNNKESLLYLANQGVLIFHSWLSAVNHLKNPDKIVFDLDPSGNSVAQLRFAARAVKKILETHKLIPFVMTTGSRGYHVVVPIKPEHSFEKIHAFTKKIARQLVDEYPDRFTVTMSKAKRKDKIFIDYLRNSYGQTSVACYSLRAHEGAPVATPIEWRELGTTKPQQYTISNIFKRLARKKDPWIDFVKKSKKLII